MILINHQNLLKALNLDTIKIKEYSVVQTECNYIDGCDILPENNFACFNSLEISKLLISFFSE